MFGLSGLLGLRAEHREHGKRMVATGILLTAAFFVMVGSAMASSIKVCVPSAEGKPILTAKAGPTCAAGYTLTELGTEGKEGKRGPEGKEGQVGKEGKEGKIAQEANAALKEKKGNRAKKAEKAHKAKKASSPAYPRKTSRRLSKSPHT